ncbi:hypothetical protein AB0C10_11430 [Microbispora amethystogenes]|uniref:hypothetical protein n=1 Tax=Microbispora amethystogenes TaxID=1427754 RepID=UPI0033DE9099
MEKSATDPVELMGDPQLLSAEVDAVPDQPEHLTPPQAEHEDQHVSGIERIVHRSQVFQEGLSLIDALHRALTLLLGLVRTGQGCQRRDVLGNQLFPYGVADRGAQDTADTRDRAAGRVALAALSQCAALPLAL